MNISKKKVLNILSIIFTIGIIYSSINLIQWRVNVDENKKVKETIQKSIVVNKKKDEFKIDFKTLKEQNPDTIAYLKVNNTKIDYIVVKTKDNSYYLKHNFEKKWNIAGWIFGDYHNRFDGTDDHLVIYGHDTKDGSMFGTLKNVLNKDWYENPDNYQVTLVTEKGNYKYQVFSTYSIEPEDYYINTEFYSAKEFSDFVKTIKSRSIYNYGTEVNENDKILTLSSCLGDGSKRVVLHAKLIKEEK